MVAALKFDGVTLPVVETEHFGTGKALQRPGEAGRRILSAGKKHQGSLVSQLVAHALPLAPSIPCANRWKVRSVRLVSLGWARDLRHTGLIFPTALVFP